MGCIILVAMLGAGWFLYLIFMLLGYGAAALGVLPVKPMEPGPCYFCKGRGYNIKFGYGKVPCPDCGGTGDNPARRFRPH